MTVIAWHWQHKNSHLSQLVATGAYFSMDSTDRYARSRRPFAYCTWIILLIVMSIFYLVDIQHVLPSPNNASRQIQARHHHLLKKDSSRPENITNGGTNIKNNIVRIDVLKNENEKRDGSVMEGTRFELNKTFSSSSSAAIRTSHSSDTKSDLEKETEKNRSWCVIGNDSMWPGVKSWGWRKSVAHVAEALLPCWSWFVDNNATENCGFYIIHNLQQPHVWGKQLMENMKCEIKYSNVPQKWNMTMTSILERDATVSEWKEILFREEYWFENRQDVDLLQKIVLANNASDKSLTLRQEPRVLQIGIVNRTGTRKIANLPELRDSIEEALSSKGISFSLSVQSLDGLTLQQQAAWFASKRIIVAAHGAGLTNSIFLQPNATVISLYPENFYFVGYFESLVTKVGGHNIDWYAGEKATARNVHAEMSTNEREAAKKIASFEVSVSDIVNLVLGALKRYMDVIESSKESESTHTNKQGLMAPFDAFPFKHLFI